MPSPNEFSEMLQGILRYAVDFDVYWEIKQKFNCASKEMLEFIIDSGSSKKANPEYVKQNFGWVDECYTILHDNKQVMVVTPKQPSFGAALNSLNTDNFDEIDEFDWLYVQSKANEIMSLAEMLDLKPVR